MGIIFIFDFSHFKKLHLLLYLIYLGTSVSAWHPNGDRQMGVLIGSLIIFEKVSTVLT